MKNPDKVKAGKARWKGVPRKELKAQMSKNGKKGAAALWSKYSLTKNEKVK